MIEIFGQSFPWDRELLKMVTDRLIKGDTLTINLRDKEAWINKWLNNPLQINIELGKIYNSLGIVGADSGNIETGDTHYLYATR